VSLKSANAFLDHVAEVLDERQEMYGDALPLFEQVATRWSLVLGVEVTAPQVALCMMDFKMARLTVDPKHLDSNVDVVGFAALLAKIQAADDGEV
jgi:hypothetical protein|tara:strand:- start:2373 stop:2657 length:285 start_codon:yes stop_codon:yes gene_type:complete